MIKFPRVYYKYLGKECYAGQYCDFGSMKGCFGINPSIEVNLSVMYGGAIDIFYTISHEMIHFLTRPLPRWLEKLIDISLDSTLGKHSKDMIFELYGIFNK